MTVRWCGQGADGGGGRTLSDLAEPVAGDNQATNGVGTSGLVI